MISSVNLLRPAIDKYSQPFWSALRDRRIELPRCNSCGRHQFPMGPCCSNCLNETFTWTAISGMGTVWSHIVYHHAFHPGFADSLPYNVVLVQLDDGPKVFSNLVGVANDAIQSGLRVKPLFHRVDDDLMLLRFEPA